MSLAFAAVSVYLPPRRFRTTFNRRRRDSSCDTRSRRCVAPPTRKPSPCSRSASSAVLKPDDVLLTITPDAGTATDLTPEADRFDRYRFRGETFTPWRPRKNYLTSLLTTLGPGKKVSFDFLRGRDKKSAEVVLEKSPVDFDTAEKLKDDGLGFTVKDLTYEVRYFQKLDAALGGVVVAKVERGSRAEVAKLQPLSIVARVNGTPLKGLEHFTALLAEARASGAKAVTFTVQNFSQTRLVDLELK